MRRVCYLLQLRDGDDDDDADDDNCYIPWFKKQQVAVLLPITSPTWPIVITHQHAMHVERDIDLADQSICPSHCGIVSK